MSKKAHVFIKTVNNFSADMAVFKYIIDYMYLDHDVRYQGKRR